MNICSRVRQLRVEYAGTRGKASFAREIGISPSTYDYYESSRVPSVGVLIRISNLTNVDIRWLLIGQEGSAGISAAHPAVLRAAKLLADRPDFAAPLAAFVDLLAEATAKFPARAPAPGEQGHQATPVVEPTGPVRRRAGRTSGKGGPTSAPEPAVKAPNPDSPPPVERQGWIPILGRSAAGIPHFWRETGGHAQEATTLGDLVATMKPLAARRVHEACAVGELGITQPNVQMVLLDSPQPPGTAEFVIAEHISQNYGAPFAVRIDGQSMEPEIRHGDVVVLSPDVPAEEGKPAVVQLVDQIGVTCKLFRSEGDRVHLIPINESFTPSTYPRRELVWALKVIARVRPV